MVAIGIALQGHIDDALAIITSLAGVILLVVALREGVVGRWEAQLQQGLAPNNSLDLELTEPAAMPGGSGTPETLKALKALGVRLVLDGFGSGCCSLTHLMHHPFDTLKIDRSHIHALGRSPQDAAIVEGMLKIARALRLEVVAHGVESTEQLEMLRALGCHTVQGNLLSRPLPAAELTAVRWA